MSQSGKALSNYRQWFLAQPKLVRVAIIPFMLAGITNYFQFFPIEDSHIRWGIVTVVVLLCAWTAYNQFIETSTWEAAKAEADKAREGEKFWQEMTDDSMHLGNLFSELVLKKSEMWLSATDMVSGSSGQPTAARDYVRSQNNLKSNLDRLITHVIYGAFQRFTTARNGEAVRVAYFVPDADNKNLEIKNLFNSQHAMPRNRAISRGQGFASYVWTRASDEPCFIHDVRTHMAAANGNSHFEYFHDSEKESIRAIFGFRVVDGSTNACLGVVCVDSNVPKIFEDEIGEATCKHIANAARARIIYETRFSLMKDSLGDYA